MKSTLPLLFMIFVGLNTRSQSIPAWKLTELNHFIDTSKSEVLIINFWATFCAPCVKEIPHFIKFSKQLNQQQVKIIFVSVDPADMYPNKLSKFIRQHHFKADFVWLNESDANFFIPSISPEWGGSIPATLFINKKTGRRTFAESELNEKELKSLVEELQTGRVREVPVSP